MDMLTEDYNSVGKCLCGVFGIHLAAGDRKGLVEEASELKFNERAVFFRQVGEG